METIKEFLNYLKRTDTKVLNYDDFLDELKNTKERDFTGTFKTNILTPKNGLIPINMFLDNLFSYVGQGHFLSNSEIKELENDTSNYTLDDEWYTYNDLYTFSEKADYLACDINMNMFINDTRNYLVFLQVYTNADKRHEFSNSVVLKFDTKEDYEDTFFYGSREYILASCLAKTEEGTTLNIEVTSEPLDTLAYMSVMDNDTRKDIFETNIYNTDFDSIKDKVTDYINSNEELNKKYHIKEFTNYNGVAKVI